MKTDRPGFTVVDLAATVVATALLAFTGARVIPLVGPEDTKRQLKDRTQLRAMMQAMSIWASNNKDTYPLPSAIDKSDSTVKEVGEAKNTTANIYSILVFDGFISPELLVSPIEPNANIAAYSEYQYASPPKAMKPSSALWDPGFSVDFTDKRPDPATKAGASYAHLQTVGGRLHRWSGAFKSSQVLLAFRGPEVTTVVYAAPESAEVSSATITLANPGSLTLDLFSSDNPKSWSANVGFNDSHVEFVANHIAQGRVIAATEEYKYFYVNSKGQKRFDILFYDDNENDAEANKTFLGMFTKAGSKRVDFNSIWD